MSDDPISIARVRLARSLPRALALPVMLGLLGLAALAAPLLIAGPAGIAVGAGGVVVMGLAVALALVPLTMRLDVEVGGLYLRWMGGGRRYRLVPGAVTRASTAGGGASVVRPRLPVPGWSYGGATLRGEERITLVRLAPTASVILVPTDHGRLAIAPASEPELLEALGAAARVQQRLDEVSGRVLAARLPEPVTEPVAEPEPAPVVPTAAAPGPRILTGIERARLEAELAAAREAALIAAEAERAALAAREAAGEPEPPPAPAPPRRRATWELEEVEPPRTAPSLARQRIRGSWTRPDWATDRRLRVLVAAGWALVPIAVSFAGYLVAGGAATVEGLDTRSRMIALALVAGGPAAAIGVLATRAWWPRLTGLVTVTAALAIVLVARATLS